MAQGKVLKTIQKRDYEALYFSAALNHTRFLMGYPYSEVPRTGDMICVLRGWPLLAYLRPVEQHSVVVGRQWDAQNKLYLPETGLITAEQTSENVERKIWKLNSIEDIQSKPEEIFRLR